MSAKQQNVPNVRFPEFSVAWEEKRLGEVFDFVQTNSLSREMLSYDVGTIQNIHYGDIHTRFKSQFYQSQETVPFIRPIAVPEKLTDEQFCRVGDLVIADASEDYADIGKAIEILGVRPNSLVAGLHTFIARPKSGSLAVGFAGYIFQTYGLRRQIMEIAQGISVLGISKVNLAKLSMPILHPNEQKKIADFLSAVDTKLAALRQSQRLLQDYKKGLMQKLFSQTVRFKRADGTAFPEWEEKELNVLAARCTAKNVLLDYMRVLTNSAVQGVIDQGDYFDKDIANVENLGGYYIVKKGDFVYNPRISTSAPVGPIKRNDVGDGVMSPLYTVFRFHASDTVFFEQYFQTTLWHDYMKSVANYGARHDRMAIGTKDFMALPIPVPHPDEQRKIADALSALDAKIAAGSAQVDKMTLFKKGLLQQMFV